jgi:hypothetical protein
VTQHALRNTRERGELSDTKHRSKIDPHMVSGSIGSRLSALGSGDPIDNDGHEAS